MLKIYRSDSEVNPTADVPRGRVWKRLRSTRAVVPILICR
jgi:hypothetical protein